MRPIKALTTICIEPNNWERFRNHCQLKNISCSSMIDKLVAIELANPNPNIISPIKKKRGEHKQNTDDENLNSSAQELNDPQIPEEINIEQFREKRVVKITSPEDIIEVQEPDNPKQSNNKITSPESDW